MNKEKIELLKDLALLKEQGVLTESEFIEQKKEILSREDSGFVGKENSKNDLESRISVLLEQANNSFKVKSFQEVVNKCEVILSLDPKNHRAWHLKAVALQSTFPSDAVIVKDYLAQKHVEKITPVISAYSNAYLYCEEDKQEKYKVTAAQGMIEYVSALLKETNAIKSTQKNNIDAELTENVIKVFTSGGKHSPYFSEYHERVIKKATECNIRKIKSAAVAFDMIIDWGVYDSNAYLLNLSIKCITTEKTTSKAVKSTKKKLMEKLKKINPQKFESLTKKDESVKEEPKKEEPKKEAEQERDLASKGCAWVTIIGLIGFFVYIYFDAIS